MYSGVAPWSIANLWCNRKIHCHGFTRIDADLKSPKAACCKASHASADPEEIATSESAAKISTCKHRKCRRAAFVASVLEIRQTHRPPSQLVREKQETGKAGRQRRCGCSDQSSSVFVFEIAVEESTDKNIATNHSLTKGVI